MANRVPPPPALDEESSQEAVLELQLKRLLSGPSRFQVHALASLHLLGRRRRRTPKSKGIPPTPTPLQLPKALSETLSELPSSGPFSRNLTAPASVASSEDYQEKKEEEEENEKEERWEQDKPCLRRDVTRSKLLHAAVTMPLLTSLPWESSSHWPGDILSLFYDICSEASQASSAPGGSLRLLCGASQLPHPEKAHGRGEDSLFMCPTGSAAGVADGVGEWHWRFGLDPRAFADELMSGARLAGERTDSQCGLTASDRASMMLSEGYESTSSFGSSTALVAALEPRGGTTLGVANLGDSGLRVLRWSGAENPGVHVAHRTYEQQHSFNCPYQLSRLPKEKDFEKLRAEGFGSLVQAVQKSKNTKQDMPCHADMYDFEVQEGDLLLLGTDGVFDNLHDHEVCQLAHRPLEVFSQRRVDPARLANAFAAAAHCRSEDCGARTPFSVNARQAGIHRSGGKMDDITVVAAWVVRS
eukprot:TRINITY_DN6565_c0_g1_i1.p1 TRINITY_DN6565_c0_g1~~TRINITY_DN6565_c0_g1_i1.p1  ORF type:complete len:489 (+),score=112.61 TRINITY_DN6565_c0_g1_i1:54-1469(+)